jgi:hypothetical protein
MKREFKQSISISRALVDFMESAKQDLAALFSSFELKGGLDLALPADTTSEADAAERDYFEDKSLDSEDLVENESSISASEITAISVMETSHVMNAAKLLKDEVLRLRKIMQERYTHFKDIVGLQLQYYYDDAYRLFDEQEISEDVFEELRSRPIESLNVYDLARLR